MLLYIGNQNQLLYERISLCLFHMFEPKSFSSDLFLLQRFLLQTFRQFEFLFKHMTQMGH